MAFESSLTGGHGLLCASFLRKLFITSRITPSMKHCRLTGVYCRIIGGALMSFLPTTNSSGILAGIYLVNAVVAPLSVFYNVRITLPSSRSVKLKALADMIFG
jgi:hypothetical protein